MSAPERQAPPAGLPPSGRQLLDATIDPTLLGTSYVNQIAKLNIRIPASRAWKEGQKWPHHTIPAEILDYSHDTTGPMLINIGLFGKFEMKRFWDDLDGMVGMIWGSWDKMHAARHTRQWDIDELRTALTGHLWSLWQEPAGFPDDRAIKKWFRGFVMYRYKNTRRAQKRERDTSPKPVKIPKPKAPRVRKKVPPTLPRFHVPHIRIPHGPPNAPAAPQPQDPFPSIRTDAPAGSQQHYRATIDPSRARAPIPVNIPQPPGTGLLGATLDKTTSPVQVPSPPQLQSNIALNMAESGNESVNLFPLGAMNLVVSWASESNVTQSSSTDKGPAYFLNLGRLGIITPDNNYSIGADRAPDLIVQALRCAPVNWDPQHEFLVLLDSRGGVRYAINGTTAMSKGRILEALREEQRLSQRDLKIKIVKRGQNLNLIQEAKMAEAKEFHEPVAANVGPPKAHEVQQDNSTQDHRSARHVDVVRVAKPIPLGFMNIIVSRSSQWNGDGYPPDDKPSYATTLNSLGVQGTGNECPAASEAVLDWLGSDHVKWDPQQELITLLGSKKGDSYSIDGAGADKILAALLEERSRNMTCLKMKIVPRVKDLGSASSDDSMDSE